MNNVNKLVCSDYCQYWLWALGSANLHSSKITLDGARSNYNTYAKCKGTNLNIYLLEKQTKQWGSHCTIQSSSQACSWSFDWCRFRQPLRGYRPRYSRPTATTAYKSKIWRTYPWANQDSRKQSHQKYPASTLQRTSTPERGWVHSTVLFSGEKW